MKVTHISEAHAKLSDWELFWEVYPRKKSKLDARKAWDQTEKIRPDIEKIIATIETLWRTDWQYRDPTYVPYPGSWLRAGGWDDE